MIPIRAIQHYAYCPHRWGLLYQEGMWAENAFTVQGDLLHERVHREKLLAKSGAGLSFGGMSLYSGTRGIYGKADLIELVRDRDGVSIAGLPGRYLVRLIEYKPTSPKTEVHPADRLQVYAQYCCARELFGERVEAYFYFADTRRRIALSFGGEDEAVLLRVLEEIRTAQENGEIPPIRIQKGCSGCSMTDRCMPRVSGIGVRDAIRGCL